MVNVIDSVLCLVVDFGISDVEPLGLVTRNIIRRIVCVCVCV